MPEKLERELRKRGRALGLTGRALDRYVYGGLRETGWKPKKDKRHK